MAGSGGWGGVLRSQSFEPPKAAMFFCGWAGVQGRLFFSHLNLWSRSFEEHFNNSCADSRKGVKFGFQCVSF